MVRWKKAVLVIVMGFVPVVALWASILYQNSDQHIANVYRLVTYLGFMMAFLFTTVTNVKYTPPRVNEAVIASFVAGIYFAVFAHLAILLTFK